MPSSAAASRCRRAETGDFERKPGAAFPLPDETSAAKMHAWPSRSLFATFPTAPGTFWRRARRTPVVRCRSISRPSCSVSQSIRALTTGSAERVILLARCRRSTRRNCSQTSKPTAVDRGRRRLGRSLAMARPGGIAFDRRSARRGVVVCAGALAGRSDERAAAATECRIARLGKRGDGVRSTHGNARPAVAVLIDRTARLATRCEREQLRRCLSCARRVSQCSSADSRRATVESAGSALHGRGRLTERGARRAHAGIVGRIP